MRPALLLIASAILLLPVPAAQAASVRGDFDGDGADDLAVGAPLDSVAGAPRAGAVNVLYGSRADGLSGRGDQQLTQATPGVQARPGRDDGFGAALAAAHVDDDRYADLVVGVPGEDIGGVDDAGAVQVFHGSRTGLTVRGDEFLSQRTPGVPGVVEPFDRFGGAVTAGGGMLAVGAPGESVGGRSGAGAVAVIRDGRGALWTKSSAGVPGVPAAGDGFGAALAIGDLSRNGHADLAVGAPGRPALLPEGPIPGAGTVTVLYGSGGGLGAPQEWSQDSAGIRGVGERGDGFGAALAIGDFDADGAGDLAVGRPYEGVRGSADAGAVSILRGSVSGLRGAGDQHWTQAVRGIKGAAETGDTFGAALAAADLSGDGAADLAVGVPREDLRGGRDAGMIQVLYGRAGRGLRAADEVRHQDTRGIKGVAEVLDLFGAALASGDFDADGDADLAAGAPFDRVGAVADAGTVSVVYAGRRGITTADERFSQATRGVKGAAGDDGFGAALAAPASRSGR